MSMKNLNEAYQIAPVTIFKERLKASLKSEKKSLRFEMLEKLHDDLFDFEKNTSPDSYNVQNLREIMFQVQEEIRYLVKHEKFYSKLFRKQLCELASAVEKVDRIKDKTKKQLALLHWKKNIVKIKVVFPELRDEYDDVKKSIDASLELLNLY